MDITKSMKNTPADKKGLSFMEILVVTVLIPIVSLAIYATFNSAVKIYQRLNNSLPQEDIAIFLNRFYDDLRNSFYFKNIAFKGERETLSFATLVYAPKLKTRIPGKIIYTYEPYKKIFKRKQSSYIDIFSSAEPAQTNFLENISNFEIKYYYYDEQKNAYIWKENDLYGKLPLAVRIEFEFIQNENKIPFVYTVSLPLSE